MSLLTLLSDDAFTPQRLFADGSVGVYYDPSDFSTLYQDAAGTTPVTAMEQSVGLMLDRSRGLAVGAERVTNGDFSNGTTGWFNNGGLATTFAVTSHDGVANALRVVGPLNAGALQVALIANGVFAVSYRIKVISGSVYVGISANPVGGIHTTANAGTWTTVTRTIYGATDANLRIYANQASTEFYVAAVSIKQIAGNHAYQTTSGARPIVTARVNQFLASATLSTQSVTTIAGSYTLSFTGTGSITLSGTATGTYSAGTNVITCTAGTLTATVTGSVTLADLRLTIDANGRIPSYQRVTTATDYDSAGFPVRLRFDGGDDFMQTAAIDWTGTDKITAWAGVRKLSDAAQAIVFESSATVASNNGTFNLSAPGSAAANLAFSSKGTTLSTLTATTFASPNSSVISATASIAGDSVTMRVNGTAQTPATGDQGTGNYTSQILYIGARAGTSLRFNGSLTALVIVGKLASTQQIQAIESWVNSKARAY